MKREVLSGVHFMSGNVACAEGAIAAGCRFFAGYPITPSTEIAERLSTRLPPIGGTHCPMGAQSPPRHPPAPRPRDPRPRRPHDPQE